MKQNINIVLQSPKKKKETKTKQTKQNKTKKTKQKKQKQNKPVSKTIRIQRLLLNI